MLLNKEFNDLLYLVLASSTDDTVISILEFLNGIPKELLIDLNKTLHEVVAPTKDYLNLENNKNKYSYIFDTTADLSRKKITLCSYSMPSDDITFSVATRLELIIDTNLGCSATYKTDTLIGKSTSSEFCTTTNMITIRNLCDYTQVSINDKTISFLVNSITYPNKQATWLTLINLDDIPEEITLDKLKNIFRETTKKNRVF